MMRVKLPRSRALQQPLSTLASLSTIILSFGMTLAAAYQHWSANPIFAVGTAVTCEICKTALFKAGVTNLRAAVTWRNQAFAIACLTLASVFAMGSVGASVLCMSQAQQTEHTRDLQSSRAYSSAQQTLRSLNAQIATLQQSADSDIAGGFRSRGLATLARLEKLNVEQRQAESNVAALERQPTHAQASASPLPDILALVGTKLPQSNAELFIECLIGLAIELAGFLFLCAPRQTRSVTDHDGPDDPGHRKPSKQQTSPRPFTLQIPVTKAAHREATSGDKAESQAKAIPPTYAKWLRFDFGPKLEATLQTLEGIRCAGACRDLLHRMGDHCLRVGWTNGSIEATTIRAHLRRGRDWRTVQSHLHRLVEAGALTVEGTQYTIAHFLAANPSVQRREQRLAEARSKNCNRQQKLRDRLQTLQGRPLQEVDLTASCTPRNAQKPQPTSHAVASQAAHAATHKPTNATNPHPCDSVGQPEGSQPARPRHHGCVAITSDVSDTEHEARMQRLAARAITAKEANEAADQFESELADTDPSPKTDSPCIPVKIPTAPPVNEGSVVAACRLIGLPEAGRRAQALFQQLSANAVTQSELTYATWCTKHRQEEGGIQQSAVGFMLGVIRRQRLAAQAT